MRLILALALGVGLALPALAQEPDAGAGDAASMRGDCICRAKGRAYLLGQSVCLETPRGARLATCGMVLNNTSWLFSQDPCTTSRAPAQPAEPSGGVRFSGSAKPSAASRSNGSSTSTKVSG